MTSQPDRPVTGSIDTDENAAGADEVREPGSVTDSEGYHSSYGAGTDPEPDFVAGPDGVTDADRTASTIPDGDVPAAADPDLVVMTAREDTDGDSTLDDSALDESALDDSDLDDSLIIAEVTETEFTSKGLNGSPVAGAGPGSTAASDRGADGLDQQWHDIQAMFVDDPRGSVDRAAAAADAAVSALVETLHQRQAALVPADSAEGDHGDTEQLREALRSYRIFCQRISELGQQLPEPAALAR